MGTVKLIGYTVIMVGIGFCEGFLLNKVNRGIGLKLANTMKIKDREFLLK